MNTSVIRYLLGYILKLEGFLLLLPCIVAGIYYEKSGIYFLIVALISIAIGFIFSAKKPRDFTFYLKEGCATTALGWVVLSIFGCLPFYISGEIPSFTDALFETISGFTTTGASSCRTAYYSGGVLRTGLAVWVCLFFFWQSSRFQAAAIST